MTLGRRNFREIYAPSRRNLEEINKRNLRLFRKKSSPEPRCLVLRAVLTAPVTPAHRSKASGGRDWVSPRGPKASLGSFRRSARTLALAVRVV